MDIKNYVNLIVDTPDENGEVRATVGFHIGESTKWNTLRIVAWNGLQALMEKMDDIYGDNWSDVDQNQARRGV